MRPSSGGVATAVALAVAAASAGIAWRAPAPCGFTIPGASPLWAEQSASVTPAAVGAGLLWIVAQRELRMQPLDAALGLLDKTATTVPQLLAAEVNESLILRSLMVPHVLRGVLAGSRLQQMAAMGRDLDGWRGLTKQLNTNRSGLVQRYYGGP